MVDESEYFEAIDNNDIEKVKKILRYENVNIQGVYGSDNEGLTPLNVAYFLQRIEIVKLLLAYPKTNINLKDTYGTTILDLVSKVYNKEIAELLLSNPKINVNVKDVDSTTPLHTACKYNNIEIVKLLLAHPNIDINSQDRWIETPLIKACYSNSIEIVKLLLFRSDIDVTLKVKIGYALKNINKYDFKNIDNVNLLCFVCQMRYVEIVKLLLSHPKIIIDYNEFIKFPKAKSVFKNYSKKNIDNILDRIEN